METQTNTLTSYNTHNELVYKQCIFLWTSIPLFSNHHHHRRHPAEQSIRKPWSGCHVVFSRRPCDPRTLILYVPLGVFTGDNSCWLNEPVYGRRSDCVQLPRWYSIMSALFPLCLPWQQSDTNICEAATHFTIGGKPEPSVVWRSLGHFQQCRKSSPASPPCLLPRVLHHGA